MKRIITLMFILGFTISGFSFAQALTGEYCYRNTKTKPVVLFEQNILNNIIENLDKGRDMPFIIETNDNGVDCLYVIDMDENIILNHQPIAKKVNDTWVPLKVYNNNIIQTTQKVLLKKIPANAHYEILQKEPKFHEMIEIK